MRGIPLLLMAIALAVAAPAASQDAGPTPREVILAALHLPEVTQEARTLGVPEADIRTIFDTARERRLPVGVLSEVFVTGNEAVREHGPIDNFGAFVQSRLDQGLRGRDLAAAIRAEHQARGIGRGKSLRAPQGAGGGKDGRGGGRPEGAGVQRGGAGKGAPGETPASAEKGGQDHRPDAAGKSAPGEKPDQAKQGGKPDAAGRGAGNAGGKGGK